MIFYILALLSLLSVATSECGTFMHYCMNYNTHWGQYQAVVETNLRGFVKTISLTESRFTGIGCTGDPFLIVSTKYSATVVKGENDSEAAQYTLKTEDIQLSSSNVTALAAKGFIAKPNITERPVSLANIELTLNGQPHLTIEKESIGSSSGTSLTFSGIVFKGIQKSPYNRVGDEGCFDTSALVGWIVGVSVVLLVIVISIFVILVQLHRGRSNSLYASYVGTGNHKKLESSLEELLSVF